MDNKTTILKGVCEMGKYIGIDLGTTFSCMAYINEEGQPVVIPNGEGKIRHRLQFYLMELQLL